MPKRGIINRKHPYLACLFHDLRHYGKYGNFGTDYDKAKVRELRGLIREYWQKRSGAYAIGRANS